MSTTGRFDESWAKNIFPRQLITKTSKLNVPLISSNTQKRLFLTLPSLPLTQGHITQALASGLRLWLSLGSIGANLAGISAYIWAPSRSPHNYPFQGPPYVALPWFAWALAPILVPYWPETLLAWNPGLKPPDRLPIFGAHEVRMATKLLARKNLFKF